MRYVYRRSCGIFGRDVGELVLEDKRVKSGGECELDPDNPVVKIYLEAGWLTPKETAPFSEKSRGRNAR